MAFFGLAVETTRPGRHGFLRVFSRFSRTTPRTPPASPRHCRPVFRASTVHTPLAYTCPGRPYTRCEADPRKVPKPLLFLPLAPAMLRPRSAPKPKIRKHKPCVALRRRPGNAATTVVRARRYPHTGCARVGREKTGRRRTKSNNSIRFPRPKPLSQGVHHPQTPCLPAASPTQ